MRLDIRSRNSGNVIARDVSEDAAAAWMDAQGTDPTTARDCLLILAADRDAHIIAGQIIVVPTGGKATEALDECKHRATRHREHVLDALEEDQRLTHYRGLLGRIEDQRATVGARMG